MKTIALFGDHRNEIAIGQKLTYKQGQHTSLGTLCGDGSVMTPIQRIAKISIRLQRTNKQISCLRRALNYTLTISGKNYRDEWLKINKEYQEELKCL